MVKKIIQTTQSLIQLNIDFIRDTIAQKKNREKLSFNGLEDLDLKTLQPVFFLSTGRCGTKLTTEYLKRHHNLVINHDQVPELIMESMYAFENPSNKKELKLIFNSARLEFIINAYLKNKIYIETNNRITFFAPQIAELFPKAKFIHLYRHPADFVRSGINRDWYEGKKLHDIGRIRPSEITDFQDKSKIFQITWLWNQTNQFIEDFKQTIPEERKLTLSAESIFRSINQINRIESFIGVQPIPSEKAVKQVNKSLNNKFPRYEDWTKDQKETFKNIISANLVDQYGYII